MNLNMMRRSAIVCLWLCSGCDLVNAAEDAASSGGGKGGSGGGTCQVEEPARTMPEQIVETEKKVHTAMVDEATAAGTAVDPDSLVDVSGNGATLVVGAVADLAKVSPANLAKGVEMAFMYLDLPRDSGGVQPELPAGYYRMRVTAPQKVLDEALTASGGVAPDLESPDDRPAVDGATVDLVGADGKIAASLPGRLGVWSLDVAPEAAKTRPTVEVIIGSRYVTIWIVCSNGSIICVRLSWPQTRNHLVD